MHKAGDCHVRFLHPRCWSTLIKKLTLSLWFTQWHNKGVIPLVWQSVVGHALVILVTAL